MTDGLIHQIHELQRDNERLMAKLARLEAEKATLEAAHDALRGEWRRNLEKLGDELNKMENLIKERTGNE